MSYRRVQEPAKSKRNALRPLPLVLVLLGLVLLVASGAQLRELLAALPSVGAARGALTAISTPPQIATSSILGAIFLPIAAVASFVAFGFTRTRSTV
jgi:hypothetical protein